MGLGLRSAERMLAKGQLDIDASLPNDWFITCGMVLYAESLSDLIGDIDRCGTQPVCCTCPLTHDAATGADEEEDAWGIA